MTAAIPQLDVPEERLQAQQVVLATDIPVGKHFSGNTDPVTDIPLTVPSDAQFLKLQAITANIRYKLDGNTVSATEGFQLAAGTSEKIPCAVNTIHIIGEGAGTYQAQFLR